MVNQQKVKNSKGQIFGLFLYIFFNKATEVLAGAMGGSNFSTTDFNFIARSALSYFCYHCTTYGDCGIFSTIQRLPRTNMPFCSIKNICSLHNDESRQCTEKMTGFIASLVGPRGRFLYISTVVIACTIHSKLSAAVDIGIVIFQQFSHSDVLLISTVSPFRSSLPCSFPFLLVIPTSFFICKCFYYVCLYII